MIRFTFKPTKYVEIFNDQYFVQTNDSDDNGEYRIVGAFEHYWDAEAFAKCVHARGRGNVYVFTRDKQVLSLYKAREAA